MVLKKIFCLLLGFTTYVLTAQNATSSEKYEGLKAFQEFQTQKYKNVVSNLSTKKSLSDSEEILLLLSELKTGNGDVSKIERWYNNHLNHPIAPLVSFNLGEYFFYQQDTVRSRSYLAAIASSELSTTDRASYGYIYGLIQLDQENYKNAISLFQFSRKHGYPDQKALDYYEAFAAYHLSDLAAALRGFKKSAEASEFETSSKFFIAKIQLEKGEIDEVINMSQSELSDDRTLTNSGFHQIIGEAYGQKQVVQKADAYFQRAIELHPSRPTAALYYQAGVAKFKIGNEEKAIEYLKEAGIQGGEYAQLSAFQLGRLYLKKGEFENALFAYMEASSSTIDAMKEEAYFQVARINAKLGNFTDAIHYSTDYLKYFKEGQWKVEIQNLIAQSYLKTSNYDLAIEHLKSIGVNTATQREVYQAVSFQKALLLFNDGKFDAAEGWFNESLKYTPDIILKNQAFYHLGEIASRKGDFDEALGLYQQQTLIDPLSHYGIGYAYFNQRKYDDALNHFRNARNASESEINQDASIRLADCLFATKSYDEAYSIYRRINNQLNSAYITFQMGKTLKDLNRSQEAIDAFTKVFSSSRFGGAARFECGMIKFEAAQFPEAIGYFKQVRSRFQDSPYVPEAILNMGISHKNIGELENAKDDYETILKKYPTDEIAFNAILGLQELQQLGVAVDDLEGYINQYKQANPNNDNLEVIEFEAAKRQYFDFAYEEATQSLQKFLNNYPGSTNKIEAKYYLGDSYYRLNKLKESEKELSDLKFIRNMYTGRILNRLGEINLLLKDNKESEEAYKLLLDLDLSLKDTYNAKYGLMKLYFENEQYTEAINQAASILQSDWKPLNGEQEAILTKAKSLKNTGNTEEAIVQYELLKEGKDVYAVEASYSIGLIQYNRGEYEESLNTLFDLNARFGSYQDWIDKSYLLIAQNYIASGELFQAKATLRSITQHAKNENVKSQSKRLLDQIEQNVIEADSTVQNDK